MIFLPYKANFRRNNCFISRKFNEVWWKNQRQIAEIGFLEVASFIPRAEHGGGASEPSAQG
ncbi:MAG: hypothetical protein FWH17_07770 [Oscillospiraceae bacterium]|nr:hypothetical protein [Oscillospiraceae bacterium]